MHHESTVIKGLQWRKKQRNRIGGDHKQTEIHMDVQIMIKVALQFSEERENSINDLEGPLIISWKKIMKLDLNY